jgi:hypothetical protein
VLPDHDNVFLTEACTKNPFFQSGGDIACAAVNQTKIDVLPDDSISALPTPGQGCQYHDRTTTSTVRSQQNYVIEVTRATGFSAFVWTGDRYSNNIRLCNHRQSFLFFVFKMATSAGSTQRT